jgi:broad specificity phosphatase PhoE
MKWPEYLMLIRHDVSTYNALKKRKQADPEYRQFVEAYKRNPNAKETIRLAKIMHKRYALSCGDHNTPLANDGEQAFKTGQRLSLEFAKELPDVIFYSPYQRTCDSMEQLMRGWPKLRNVKAYEDERIREQGHGLANLYNDWRIFFTLHPEQRELYELEGSYWYRYPQGENVPDVRERNRAWKTTLVREFAGKRVLAVTHHLNILSYRVNQERLTAADFRRLDEEEKPINAGVTLYRGNKDAGKDGRLELAFYNKRYY